jgi:HEAT repeat protein
MNAILKKIAKLVNAEEDEIKCSAIRVLGELGIREQSVLKLLGSKLATDTEPVKIAVLDALIRTPQPMALTYLLPLLKVDGNLRRKAIHAIGAIGPKAIVVLEKEFRSASLQEKRLFIDIFSMIRTKATLDFLIDSLVGSDLELLKYICFALRNQIEKMEEPERLYLLKKVTHFLSLPEVKKNDEMTTSGLLLLGFIARPQAKKILLKFLDRKRSFYVRKNALYALTRLGLTGRSHDDMVEKVFPLLDDPDFPNVVRNALTILETVELTRRYTRELTRLLEATRHPSVKRFALKRLAEVGNSKTLKILITHLDSNDPMIRDAAADSLAKLPRAVPDLMKKLEATQELERGEKIALILRNHRDVFKRERCSAIYRKLEKGLAKREPQSKIYALLLKHVNPDFLYAESFKRARQLKRAKKFELAKQYLELLATGLFYTDDVRYELASVLLKISKKDLNPQARNEDAALNLFAVLARSNLGNLVKLVKTDRVLDANDLYYLGFHFAEKLFEQKAFGIDVLKTLLKRYPRSKVKAAAKKKMALAGPVASARESTFAPPGSGKGSLLARTPA